MRRPWIWPHPGRGPEHCLSTAIRGDGLQRLLQGQRPQAAAVRLQVRPRPLLCRTVGGQAGRPSARARRCLTAAVTAMRRPWIWPHPGRGPEHCLSTAIRGEGLQRLLQGQRLRAAAARRPVRPVSLWCRPVGGWGGRPSARPRRCLTPSVTAMRRPWIRPHPGRGGELRWPTAIMGGRQRRLLRGQRPRAAAARRPVRPRPLLCRTVGGRAGRPRARARPCLTMV